METLVSMLILGILLTTVVSTIRFSLGVTGDSLRNAEESQTHMNNLVTGNFTTAPHVLTFSSANITITGTKHNVKYIAEDGLVVFLPE